MAISAERQIRVLQYGPCWCRAGAERPGAFDLLRHRTASVVAGALDQHLLIATDRVIAGARHSFTRAYHDMPDPKLVIATAPCPATADFWDEVAGGWTPLDEVIPVDVRVEECISGYPEALVAAVLDHIHVASAPIRPASTAVGSLG